MRGLKKDTLKGDRQSGHKLTSQLYEKIGLRADSLKITPIDSMTLRTPGKVLLNPGSYTYSVSYTLVDEASQITKI